jgi:Domain of unknown function (DUF5658)
MDVTAAVFTVAITIGSLTTGQDGRPLSEAPIAEALASAPAPLVVERTDLLSLRRLAIVPPSPARPAALIPMYASLAALQAFDIHTTSASLKHGAVEANPLMKPVAGRNVASIVVKAAATAGSIYFVERAWKQNRKGAVILMTAINVTTAAIVVHNTHVARSR